MPRYVHPELKPLVQAAEKQGWTLDYTKRGHLKLVPPTGGTPVYAAGTPSDWRSVKNTAAMLRRAGVKGV